MSELLQNGLAPITNEIGFLECDANTIADAYLSWMGPIHVKRGVHLTRGAAHGNLREVLSLLLPLTSVERRRFLFIPTNSRWTAYFDNGHQGPDAFPPMGYLSRTIGCKGLRVLHVEEGSTKAFPANALNIYGPDVVEYSNTIRSIGMGYDGYKWEFASSGMIQPFEDLKAYTEDRVQDRFPFHLLKRYLSRLGLRPFDEDFYLPDSAILIQKEGPGIARSKEFGLDDDLAPGGSTGAKSLSAPRSPLGPVE